MLCKRCGKQTFGRLCAICSGEKPGLTTGDTVQRLIDAAKYLIYEQTKVTGYQWWSWVNECAENNDPVAKAWVELTDALNAIKEDKP
jgi:hypothetical protein